MAEEKEIPEPAEEKEIPEPAEESGGEAGAEKPAGAEEAVSAEQPKDVQEAKAPEEVSKDARTWGMLCHLLAIFTCFIGPLIVWLVKKEEDPFIDNQGKEALNFQITVVICGFASFLLTATGIGACVGLPLLVAVSVVDLVFCIMGTVSANNGIAYRYPVSIRFIK